MSGEREFVKGLSRAAKVALAEGVIRGVNDEVARRVAEILSQPEGLLVVDMVASLAMDLRRRNSSVEVATLAAVALLQLAGVSTDVVAGRSGTDRGE